MESSIKGELAERYANRELMKMWVQFWNLAKVMAVIGILYSTHTMEFFVFTVAVGMLIVVYKINKSYPQAELAR